MNYGVLLRNLGAQRPRIAFAEQQVEQRLVGPPIRPFACARRDFVIPFHFNGELAETVAVQSIKNTSSPELATSARCSPSSCQAAAIAA
jgi:hypothetical protein